ncbi:hypothetical protein U9M48_040198, partial [Paspalum notatum var. saurae]
EKKEQKKITLEFPTWKQLVGLDEMGEEHKESECSLHLFAAVYFAPSCSPHRTPDPADEKHPGSHLIPQTSPSIENQTGPDRTWSAVLAATAWCADEKSANPMGCSPLKLIWEASNPGSQRSRLWSSRSLTSRGSPVMKMVRTSSAAVVPGAPGTGGGGGTAAEAAAPGGGGAAAAGGHC